MAANNTMIILVVLIFVCISISISSSSLLGGGGYWYLSSTPTPTNKGSRTTTTAPTTAAPSVARTPTTTAPAAAGTPTTTAAPSAAGTPTTTTAPAPAADLSKYTKIIGKDSADNDLECSSDSKTAQQCADMCEKDSKCVGFSLGNDNKCCTKSKLNVLTDSSARTFYVKSGVSIPTPAPTTKIQAGNKSFCIDVPGGDTSKPLTIYQCQDNNDNQVFYYDSSKKQIKHKSGKCLDTSFNWHNIARGILGNLSNAVLLNSCDDRNDDQKWEKDGNRLKTVNKGYCLDVHNNNFNNGAVLQTWDCHDGTNQKWYMV